MRIERIANNVLKVTISRADFASRNIDSMHLKVTSRSYRNFINDIVAHAENKLGFDAQSGQLMIETHPGKRPGDYVVIIKGLGNPLANSVNPSDQPSQDSLSFMESFIAGFRKSLGIPSDAGDVQSDKAENDQDVIPDLPKLPPIPFSAQLPAQTDVDPAEISRRGKEPDTIYDHYDIICFEDFEDLIAFCRTFTSKIRTATALYTYNDAYFLLLRITKASMTSINRIESRAMEFNGLFLPSEIVLPLLQEHGTPILMKAAIRTIAEKFGNC